jgi:hypothetical protein
MKTVRKGTNPARGKSRRSRGKALVPAAKNTYRTRDMAAAGYRTSRLAR